mmetsp:Transcript_27013/g.62989  ORF Transcript_27013/g.62989 Transcript_27013/m.62989 type:complete len:228 (+) Transcript_27013:272-955(+)
MGTDWWFAKRRRSAKVAEQGAQAVSPDASLLRGRIVRPLQQDVGGLEVAMENALSMEMLETQENVQQEVPDLCGHQWCLGPCGVAVVPDELIQGTAVAILHQDEEEGHERAEGRAPRKLQPRMLVFDDVGMVQALKGLHLPDHVAQPGLVVANRDLLHRVVSKCQVVEHMAAKEDCAEAAGAEWPRLIEEACVVASVQQTRWQLPQSSSRCSLRFCPALRGHHRDLW